MPCNRYVLLNVPTGNFNFKVSVASTNLSTKSFPIIFRLSSGSVIPFRAVKNDSEASIDSSWTFGSILIIKKQKSKAKSDKEQYGKVIGEDDRKEDENEKEDRKEDE